MSSMTIVEECTDYKMYMVQVGRRSEWATLKSRVGFAELYSAW